MHRPPRAPRSFAPLVLLSHIALAPIAPAAQPAPETIGLEAVQEDGTECVAAYGHELRPWSLRDLSEHELLARATARIRSGERTSSPDVTLAQKREALRELFFRLRELKAKAGNLGRPAGPAAAQAYQALRAKLLAAHQVYVSLTRDRIVPNVPIKVAVEDLEQEGLLGLLRAIDQFDPTRNAEFISLAVALIRGAMFKYLRREDWTPRSVRNRSKVIEAAKIRLSLRLGRPPTYEELRDELERTGEMTESVLLESLALLEQEVFSLADVLAEGDWEEPNANPLQERVRDPDPGVDPQARHEREARRLAVHEAVQLLPRQERIVLALYYFHGWKHEQIANKALQVSTGRIHQIMRSGKTRLAQLLQDYAPGESSSR